MVRTITLCLGLAILPAAGFAQVYKCTNANGTVAYQGMPCGSARQERPATIQAVPPAGRPQSSTPGYTSRSTTPPPPPPVPAQHPHTVINNYQTVIVQPDNSAQDTPPDNKQDACNWAREKRTRTEKYYRSHSIDIPWDIKRELDDLVFEKC